MSKFPIIAASLQAIIDAVKAGEGIPDFQKLDVDAACAEVARVLNGTVLPRRVTMRSDSGARLSVVAKNRRVIKVAEVHPLDHWEGDDSPQDTACVAEFEPFGEAFAKALLAVIGGGGFSIEQALISDPMGPDTHSGYPASSLSEHVEQARAGTPNTELIQEFYDAFSGQPRARFGRETEVDVPKGFAVDEAWMKSQFTELRDDTSRKAGDLRFFMLDGDEPSGFALACLGDEGAIVFSENPDQFDELEGTLGALGARLPA